jgi:hypothetical protein
MDLRLASLKAVSFLFSAQYFNTESIAESYPVAQLYVIILLATKVTLITDGI